MACSPRAPAGGWLRQWVFSRAWMELEPRPLPQPSPIWRDQCGLNGSSSCETSSETFPSALSIWRDSHCSFPGPQSRAALKLTVKFEEDHYKMPRSFLVKKYFSNKKPNYSELESQTGECAFKSCLLFYAISVCELKQLMFRQNLTQSYHNILHHKCWHHFLNFIILLSYFNYLRYYFKIIVFSV